MAHFCDEHQITGLSAEADDLSRVVREHIREHASLAQYSSKAWLPGVWSENDETLRDALVEDLGSPVASGYMSEECGWDVTEYVEIQSA